MSIANPKIERTKQRLKKILARSGRRPWLNLGILSALTICLVFLFSFILPTISMAKTTILEDGNGGNPDQTVFGGDQSPGFTVDTNGAITDKSEIKADLSWNDQPVNFSPDIATTGNNDQFKIKIAENQFRPGLYKLSVQLSSGLVSKTLTENFIWGVLALNSDKDVYAPGEMAYLQMGALNEIGQTLCKANLKLEITDPQSQVKVLATQDKTIASSNVCSQDNVTDQPDYFANYEVADIGTYLLKLTNLDNGYSIDSSFKAEKQPSFQVGRESSSRINPFKSGYTMTLKITAGGNFYGNIKEKVPASFIVSDISDGGKVSSQNDNDRQIIWPATINNSETLTLSYQYQAPKISPEFYLVGPLEINSETPPAKEPELTRPATSGDNIIGDETGSGDSVSGTVVNSNDGIPKESTDNSSTIQASTLEPYTEARQWQIAADTYTISGTVYTAENNSTNIGTGKTIKMSINGGAAISTTTNASGQFTFNNPTVGAGNTLGIYVSGDANKASYITIAADGSTSITGLALYTTHVLLSQENAAVMTNALLGTANTIADADMLISTSSGVTTFTNNNTVRIVSGKTYQPGANATINGNFQLYGTFVPQANTININGGWDATGGAFTKGTSTINFTGAGANNTIASNSQQFYNVTVNSGVIGYWNMDESSGTITVADSSGNNNTATANSTTDINTGQYGNARTYNGSSDFINLPSAVMNNFTTGLTFSIWAKPTSTPAWSRFIDLGNTGTTNNGILLYRGGPNGGTSNDLSFVVFNGATNGGAVTLSNGIINNAWHLYTVTEDTLGHVVIYRDGGVASVSGTTAVPPNVTRSNDYIGKSNNGDALYGGSTDEVRIFNRALTATEVSNLYNNNTTSVYSLSSDLTVSNNFTMTAGALTAGTNNITTVNYVQTGSTFTAPTSSASTGLSVSGNFTNSGGTFTAPASSTVNLTGAGGTTQVVSGSTTFANLTATASSAREIDFASGSTQTVTGTWTVTGAAGQLITLGRNGGSGSNQWSINPTTVSVNYVAVANSNNTASASINPAVWTNTSNNTNWFIISGTVYTAENNSTNIGTGKTIKMSINGGAAISTTTNASGQFTFASPTVAAGNTLGIYVSGDTNKASYIDIATNNTVNITGLALYTTHVLLSQENATAMTNALLGTANTIADADMLISTSSGVTTFTNNNTVRIVSGKTYQPGGTVTINGNFQLYGTFVPQANTININGGWDATGGTFTKGTSTINFTGAGADNTIASNSQQFYNLTVNSNIIGYWNMNESSGTATVADSSGNKATAASNSTTDVGTGQYGNARTFNGSSDFVSLPSTGMNNFTTGLTFSIWAKPTSSPAWSRFIDLGNTGTINNSIVLYRGGPNGGTSNDLSFDVFNGASDGGAVTLSSGIINSAWHLYTVTEDTLGHVVIYRDGGVASVTGTTAVPPNVTRSNDYIGKSNNADPLYGGSTDEVRIFNRALTATEVSNLYNNNTTSVYSLSSDLTVSNNFTMTAGALTAGTNNITTVNYVQTGSTFTAPTSSASTGLSVSGNFTNSGGTFTAGTGTIILSGASAQTFTAGGTGSTYNPYNLTVTNASASGVTFADSVTLGTGGTFTDTTNNSKLIFTTAKIYTFPNISIHGTTGNNVILTSTNASPGTPSGPTWSFVVSQASPVVTYATVYDSNATGSSGQINATGNCTNSGNNTYWNFAVAPNSPTSFTQLTSPGNAGIGESAWTADSTPALNFSITDPNSLTVKYEIQIATNSGFSSLVLDYTDSNLSSSGTAFTFTPGSYTNGTCSGTCPATLADNSTGYWWKVKAINSSNLSSSFVEFGVAGTMDFKVDATAPSGGSITNSSNTGSLTQLAASWSGFSDPTSGINKYEYAIGTTSGSTDIKTWTNNGTDTGVTATGLNLQTSVKYFFSVRATDNVGNVDSPVSASSQYVLPTLSFSINNNKVIFSNLNAGNSWADTKTTTVHTITNAANGYSVLAYADGLLTATGYPLLTIPNYSGTYSSPSSWSGTGFGYTSSDPDISGSNKWASSTNFCAFNSSPPGDIVADHEAAINGSTGNANDTYIIAYKVVAPSAQPASTYRTTINYIILPNY